MSRIVIADDHPLMLSGLVALLGQSSHDIVGKATNGAEALLLIEQLEPDIVVLDARMPEKSGIEVVQDLIAKGRRPAVVVLTADLNDDDLVALMDAGVEGIVLKNGGEHLLVDCLDKVASGRNAIPRELRNRHTQLMASRSQSPLNSLSHRDREIIALVRKGLRNRAIGEELGLTEGTVKVYLNRIYEKLSVSSRTELLMVLQTLV